jgi:hypothetical protein
MAASPVFTLQDRNFSAMNLEGELSGKRMRYLEISGLGRGDAKAMALTQKCNPTYMGKAFT